MAVISTCVSLSLTHSAIYATLNKLIDEDVGEDVGQMLPGSVE
jgi:hypothetical protein